MEQNKTGKYLKYAIGEIILVMVGILLALQVNNWNQQRLEKKEEKIILSNLKEDYRSAIQEFESLNLMRNYIISAAKNIFELSPKTIEKYSTTYLDSIFSKTMTGPTFNNKSGSLDVLLTSGKINLISNQSLRKKLIEWPGDVEDMIEDEINHNETYLGKYTDIIDKYLSWTDLAKGLTTARIRFSGITLETMPENPIISSDYKSLINNMEFLNTLSRRVIYCTITNDETKILIEKAKEIITIIDDEL